MQAPMKLPSGSFTAPGLHIDGASFEWLRAYLHRAEARVPQGVTEEDVGNSSETGSTSDSLEGTDLSSPSLSSHVRPEDGIVPLARPMSYDERLYDMDSVGMGQGTFKRRRKVRVVPEAPRNTELLPAAAARTSPAPSLPSLTPTPRVCPLFPATGRLEFDGRPRHPSNRPPPGHPMAPHRSAVPRSHLGRRAESVAQAAEDALAGRL
jgi:hypothetical protein